MPTKTVSRQQSQTPAQQLQLQQQRDVENGLYPNIPPERRSPQARPVRPPTLRQDTIDMEEIPLNQANSMQEPEDRRKMREIFDKVKQCTLSHSLSLWHSLSLFLSLSHFLSCFSVCVRVMNEFPCCPWRESCGESSTMTPSISPPLPFAYSPSPQPFPQLNTTACMHMQVLARTVTLYFYACAAATAHPPYAGGRGRGNLIATSERQLRHSGQLHSFPHTFAYLSFCWFFANWQSGGRRGGRAWKTNCYRISKMYRTQTG